MNGKALADDPARALFIGPYVADFCFYPSGYGNIFLFLETEALNPLCHTLTLYFLLFWPSAYGPIVAVWLELPLILR